MDPVAITVFAAFFVLVTVLGFVAARWRRPKTLAHLDEWGLGGRKFGTWVTWFLLGGDVYTAYTMIAVPALVYGLGAYGFYAVPYAIMVYPLVFVVMPVLWKVAHAKGHVTAADIVHATYPSRPLELAVAATGVIATMPYIALQLIGMAAVIHALGLEGELPLVAAFIVLALYTYSSGLRAPALIAFVKDTMLYIVVLVVVVAIPLELGGYGAIFAAADTAFQAKGTGGILLAPSQYLPFASLALGSTLALFLYPHALTGVLASASADTIRKNAILLPAYSLLLGLVAFLGFMGHAAGLKLGDSNLVVPVLLKAYFPGWFTGFALVPAAIMSIGAANLFTRNFWKPYIDRNVTPAGEAKIAKRTSLVVKFGALLVILYLPTQFAIYLHLLGGMWILQTFPALVLGLFVPHWFRAEGLLAGWVVGFSGGTFLAWWNGFKPVHTIVLGETSLGLYIGLLALAANLVVALCVSGAVSIGSRASVVPQR
jgi:SSS family solute:Na+ symporter